MVPVPIGWERSMDRPVDRRSALPLFEQVYRRLREAIHAGRFGHDNKLPPEEELCRLFDVSRQTVRRAMLILSEEGLIVRRRRYGTFVTGVGAMERLRAERSQIGVVVRDMRYVTGEIVGGVSSEAFCRGFSTIVANLERCDLPGAENVAIKRMIDDGVAGVILWPWQARDVERYEVLSEARIPVVVVRGKLGLAADTINEANADGMELAVQHLYRLGHRRLGYATLDIPYFLPAFPERLRGFARAVKRLAMESRPDWILRVAFSEDENQLVNALRQRIERVELPTAFCCFNDRIAVALVRALDALGLAVPRDVSVTGYDDSMLAVSNHPSLTSVALRKYDLGATAASVLINRILGTRKCAPEEILIPNDLIQRQSTAPKGASSEECESKRYGTAVR